MAATIRVYGEDATITDGVWSCPDANVQRLLNAFLPTLFPFGPAGFPEPDNVFAIETAKKLGGAVLSLKPPPEGAEESGVIF